MNRFVIQGGSLSAKELEAAAVERQYIRRPAVLLTTGTHNNGKDLFTFTTDDLKKIVENTKKLSADGKVPQLRVKHSSNAWDHIGFVPADGLRISEDGNRITGILEFRDENARQKIKNELWEPGKQALSVGVYGDSKEDQYLAEVSIVETGACPDAVMLEDNKGGIDMTKTAGNQAAEVKPQETATAENIELKATLEKQAKELENLKQAQDDLLKRIGTAFGKGTDTVKIALEKQEPAQAMALLGDTIEAMGRKLEASAKEQQAMRAELEAEKAARKQEADAKTIDSFVASGKILPAVRDQELALFALLPEPARKIYLEKMDKTPPVIQLAGNPLDKPAPTAEDETFMVELAAAAERRGIKLEKK